MVPEGRAGSTARAPWSPAGAEASGPPRLAAHVLSSLHTRYNAGAATITPRYIGEAAIPLVRVCLVVETNIPPAPAIAGAEHVHSGKV
ncbi:MAG: hypothetical protein ABI873_02595, partial [Marmoricola sp.]